MFFFSFGATASIRPEVSKVAEVCDCSVEIPCSNGEAILLEIHDRAAHCETNLEKELSKIKSAPFPYCDDRKYPKQLPRVDKTNCERMRLEPWHCRDGKEGTEICAQFLKLKNLNTKCGNDSGCRRDLQSEGHSLSRLRKKIENSLSALNAPEVPTSSEPIFYEQETDQNITPPAEEGTESIDFLKFLESEEQTEEPPEPIESKEENKTTRLRSSSGMKIHHYLTERIGNQAKWLAQKFCQNGVYTPRPLSSSQLKNIKQISRDLSFFQKVTNRYPVIDCALWPEEKIGK